MTPILKLLIGSWWCFWSCLGEVSSWDQLENKRRPTWNLKQPLQSVVSVASFQTFTWEIVVSSNNHLNHLKWMFQVLASGTSTNFDARIPTGWSIDTMNSTEIVQHSPGQRTSGFFVWGSPMILEGRDYSGSLKIDQRSVVWVNFRGWWEYPFWVGIVRVCYWNPYQSTSISWNSACFFRLPLQDHEKVSTIAQRVVQYFLQSPTKSWRWARRRSSASMRPKKPARKEEWKKKAGTDQKISKASWLERPGSFATSEGGGLWPFGHGCVALSCHGSCKPRFWDWRRRCCSGSRSTAAANWVPSHHQGAQASVLIALAGFDLDREGTHDVKGFLFSWFFSSFYTLILYAVSFLSPNVSEKLA